MSSERNLNCEQRIDAALAGRLADLRRLWTAYTDGKEDAEEGTLDEYGLSFDYVVPGTFDDQKEGYFRYQISWGGPSDEFRFFVNPDLSCHRVEYRFMDWFDGARRVLDAHNLETMMKLWEWFTENGCVIAEYRKAMR